MPVWRGPHIDSLLGNGSSASLPSSPFASFNGSGFPWEQIIGNNPATTELELSRKVDVRVHFITKFSLYLEHIIETGNQKYNKGDFYIW
jgi:hypothetical protein